MTAASSGKRRGRPLKGARWTRHGSFYGALPIALGERRRVEYAFADEGQREAWLSAGIAALHAGRPLPDPKLFRSRVAATPDESGPERSKGPVFDDLAHGWADEYYRDLRNGGPERERNVRILIEKYLVPELGGPIPIDPAIARRQLVEFVRRLALEPEWDEQRDYDIATDEVLSIAQAVAAGSQSESSIRRALRADRLPGARRGAGGWRIPRRDLVAAGLLRTSPKREAVSREYATDLLWVYRSILEWGRINGWDIPDFARGVNALTPDEEVARKNAEASLRRPLTIGEVARVATHLHPAHQLTLWLMRIVGLRISEVFGPCVGDLVDLGDVGLLMVHRQGGKPFLIRTRDGVVTRFRKEAVKRAASRRAIVVPASLMALLRVVIDAFHTDPETGVVDLDARLVPWLNKEGRGQAAFRAALDDALRRERFEFDAAGFDVTCHDFRKSLATVLAWDAELDELAKRRWMGHKAGDDVFARVYTLDHPTIAPLAAIATAVERDIAEHVGSLLVPTERRTRWGAKNPLRERESFVQAVLAESGWQVEPGGGENPWCDPARVAVELGIAETTARRWMADQIVHSVVDLDRYGNPRRRARLEDVHTVRTRLSQRVLLRDLATELGVGYHRAWHTMRRLGLNPERDARTDEFLLGSAEVGLLREEFRRLGALANRSLRISAAADELGVAVSTVKRFISTGELIEDRERDQFDARYVTRESVGELRQKRSGVRPQCALGEVIGMRDLRNLTGLTDQQLSDLMARGLLRRRDVKRRFHVTVESVRKWAAGFRPDLLAVLDAVEDDRGMDVSA